MTKRVYCGFWQKACHVDTIMADANFELSTKTHELLYNKEQLLNNRDKWEVEISANIQAEHMHGWPGHLVQSCGPCCP